MEHDRIPTISGPTHETELTPALPPRRTPSPAALAESREAYELPAEPEQRFHDEAYRGAFMEAEPADGEPPRPALPPRIHEQPPAYGAQEYYTGPVADEKRADPATGFPQDPEQQQQQQQQLQFPPPPKSHSSFLGRENDDASSPIHYSRDPKRLVAYIVPFPPPKLPAGKGTVEELPGRFLVYTPPPPPFLDKVAEGEKESKLHKVQRKWLEEIREAKTSDAKALSWKGVKSKAVRGINWGMGQTKSSNLEFLNRIGGSDSSHHDKGKNAAQVDGGAEHEQVEGADGAGASTATDTNDNGKAPPLEEMVLVHPASMGNDQTALRKEFIDTMMRSKSKAQRDAIIATGLLPVSAAADIALTLIWPFGGLLEIDSVWAYASIRGAKNSRSLTKRLNASQTGGAEDDGKSLRLTFAPSSRLSVLQKYLAHRCHERSSDLFPYVGSPPSESEVLEAIGWLPSSKGGAERNWEDEQWEIAEVKEDLSNVMSKAAKEWSKWCRLYADDPAKALKK